MISSTELRCILGWPTTSLRPSRAMAKRKPRNCRVDPGCILQRTFSSLLLVSLSQKATKLPVRRRSHPNPTRTLELVKHTLEEFALVCCDVAFTLDNLAVNRNNLRKGRVLSIPKASQFSISWSCKLIETAERLHIRCI